MLGPARRPQLRRPADAEPLGLPAAEHHHRLVAHRHPAAPRRRPGPGVAPSGATTGSRCAGSARRPSSKGDFHEAPQLRRHPPAAGGVRVREQRLRHLGDRWPCSRRCPTWPPGPPSYGMPGVIVDGNDALDGLRRRAARPMARARVGRRPDAGRVQDLPAPAPHVRRRRPPLPQSARRCRSGGRRTRCPACGAYLVGTGPALGRRRRRRWTSEVRAEVDEAARTGGGGRPRHGRRRPSPGSTPGRCGPSPGRPARARRGAGARRRWPRPGRPPGVVRTVLDTVRQTLARPHGRGRAGGRAGRGRRACWAGCSGPPTGCTPPSAPTRVIDTPLAESSIVGIGIGLALAGLRPVVEIQFADFMHSAFDQLVSEAAKIHYRSNGDFHVPMVVRAPWGGGGHRGALPLPGHRGLLRPRGRAQGGVPVHPGRRGRPAAGGGGGPRPGAVPRAQEDLPADQGPGARGRLAGAHRRGRRRPRRATTSPSSPTACTATCRWRRPRRCDEEGYSVEVIDLRTISPLDRDTVLGSVCAHRPAAGRPRGQHQLRRGRRGGGHRGRGGVLRPRRPRPPPGHARRPRHALRGRPGEAPSPSASTTSRTPPAP